MLGNQDGSMSKVVFLNIPAHGHTNPTLGIVRELIARGEEVIYFSFPEFKDKIEHTGAKYREYKGFPQSYNTKQSYAFIKTLNFIRHLRCKDIVYLKEGKRIQNLLEKKYNLQKKDFLSTLINTSDLNLIYTSRSLQPQSEKLCSEKYIFIGPSHSYNNNYSNKSEYSSLKKPIIYISLGTILHNNPEFYKHCFEALDDFEGSVIISIGTETKINDLGNIPKNFVIKSYVNQIEVLKQSKLFISHGGMNSVHESLLYAVPLCVYPFHVEQEAVAERIKETGCGIILKKLNSKEIKKAVEKICKDDSYQTNCKKQSDNLIKAGGYKTGVDSILTFKEKNVSV